MSNNHHKLAPLFNPSSIVFVGASSHPLKWGFRILLNILEGGYGGEIYPVNPREKEILGLEVCPSIADLPQSADLAVVVIPPLSVPQAVRECVQKGVKSAVIITAGFGELGEEGERLQREMVEIAREGGMPLVGPNCNGIMNPALRLYAVMPPVFPKPGSLGMVTQSGNVGTSVIRRAITYGTGFSKYVGTGNEGDLHNEDYIEYLADDPETKVIVTYIEGLKAGRRFFEVAKEVTRKKPVIALKVGGTTAGARAARSHTGSLSGSDEAFIALCKQAGIIRAKDQDELFHIAMGFMGQPFPKGRRVGIVTGGGGWGVIASDACARVGLDVVELPPATLKELDGFLPSWWSRNNPVDLVAGLNERDLRDSLEALLRCPDVDGAILLLGIRHLWRLGITLGKSDEKESSPYSHWYKTIAELVRKGGGDGGMMEMVQGLIARYGKPIVFAEERLETVAERQPEVALGLQDTEMIFHPSPDCAALVMVSLAQYAEYLRGELW